MRVRLQQVTPATSVSLAMPLVPLVATLQVTSLLLTEEAGVHAVVSGRPNGTGRTISCAGAIARHGLR